MAQTTFTDNVVVQGTRDVSQFEVQGIAAQTTPLQKWKTNAGIVKTQVTAEGRLQVGDNLTAGTVSDALMQANGDITLPSSQIASGIHTIGKVQGPLSNSVTWAVHELQLTGTDSVSGVHTTSRHKLNYTSTGDPTNADLRATETQATNEKGTSAQRLGNLTGLRAILTNAANAFLGRGSAVQAIVTNDAGGNVNTAIGVEVLTPVNNAAGAIGQLMGMRVADMSGVAGTVNNYTALSLENDMELKLQSATPTKTPSANFIKFYPKLFNALPRLYAKNAAGAEYDLAGPRSRQSIVWRIPNNPNALSCSSGSFVDLESTQLSITLPISTGSALIGFSAMGYVGSVSAAGNGADFDIAVDGTRIGGGANGLAGYAFPGTATPYNVPIAFTALKTGLSVGNHTFRIQARSRNSPTALYLWVGSNLTGNDFAIQFWVQEV